MQTKLSRIKYLLGLGTALVATACVSTRDESGTNRPASAKPVSSASAAPLAVTYTCSMHPEIVKTAPGRCPICGMDLVKKENAKPEGSAR